ncbi:MAG: hypothetical protein AAF959_01635 [Cyanobacteria bacterium P01_D01_bin.56]
MTVQRITTTQLRGWHNAALWQLLDWQMQAAFDDLQWNSDPENAWQDWNDRGRERWWSWIEEDDTLSSIACLKVRLWYQLWQLQQEGS